ncbi:unnamed protein product [Pedinophyceae sp. YPF-701]|nr:unnamed protein product [Pedinophyceae sp. YPF-701]
MQQLAAAVGGCAPAAQVRGGFRARGAGRVARRGLRAQAIPMVSEYPKDAGAQECLRTYQRAINDGDAEALAGMAAEGVTGGDMFGALRFSGVDELREQYGRLLGSVTLRCTLPIAAMDEDNREVYSLCEWSLRGMKDTYLGVDPSAIDGERLRGATGVVAMRLDSAGRITSLREYRSMHVPERLALLADQQRGRNTYGLQWPLEVLPAELPPDMIVDNAMALESFAVEMNFPGTPAEGLLSTWVTDDVTFVTVGSLPGLPEKTSGVEELTQVLADWKQATDFTIRILSTAPCEDRDVGFLRLEILFQHGDDARFQEAVTAVMVCTLRDGRVARALLFREPSRQEMQELRGGATEGAARGGDSVSASLDMDGLGAAAGVGSLDNGLQDY